MNGNLHENKFKRKEECKMKKKFLLFGVSFVMGVSLLVTGVSPPNTNITATQNSYNSLDEAFVEFVNWSKVNTESMDNSNIKDFLIINNINNSGSIYYDIDEIPISGLNTELEYLTDVYNKAESIVIQEDEEYNENITSEEKRTSQRLCIIDDNRYKLSSFAENISKLISDDDSMVSDIQSLTDISDVIIAAGNIGTTDDYIFGILINDGVNKSIYASKEPENNTNYTNYLQNGYVFVTVDAFEPADTDEKIMYLRYIALLYAGGYETAEIDTLIKSNMLFDDNLATVVSKLNEYQKDNCQHLYHIMNYENATCATNGSYDAVCEICDYKTTKTLSSSEANHTNLITYTSDNTPKDGSVTCECGEPVMQVKECLDCGYIEQTNLTTQNDDGESVNVVKEHNYKKLSAIPSTCIEKGKNIYKCTECGDTYELNKEIDKNNHLNTSYIIKEEPTCTKQGYKVLYCSDCDTELGEKVYIDTLGHEWVQSNTSTGDCKVSTTITYTCTRCGEEKTEYGEKGTNHNKNYIKERVALEPTCTAEGIIEEYCENCNVVVSTKSIPMVSHSYEGKTTVEATCMTKEETTFTCSVCNDSYVVYGDTKPDNHKSAEWQETKESNCSTHGEESLICNECGKHLSTRETDLSEHSYEEKITIEPTCSSYGESSSVCTICGDIKSTKKIAKLSHTPTECEDGVVRCEICNEELGYIITYDANGGVCEKTSDYGETGTSITLPIPTRAGYVFNGWYNELGIKVTTLKITTNIKLTAMWTSIPIKITYNANGGNASKQTQTYYAGDILELPTATKSGYLFEGWFIDDEMLIDGEVIETSENLVATAKWTKLELEKPRVIKATKTSLTVESVEDAVGYQVYISSNTKFKPRKSYSNTNEIINVSEMTRGETYIAIRTVGKDSSGKFIYSAWKYYKY